MISHPSARSFLLQLLAFLAFVVASSRGTAQEAPPASETAAEAHLGKGYEALKQDQYDIAVTEFRSALALDPSLAERARFPLAVALFESNQLADARKEFESLRKEVGDHPNVLYYLGRLDIENGDFKSAADNLTKAAEKPPFPDTAYYLGFALLKTGDLAGAEKWLNKATELTPRDSRVEFQLSKLYREQGREQDAKEALAKSEDLRQQDENKSRLKLECVQKLDQGQREEARPICEKLYDPENPDVLTSLGTIYGQHGEFDGALKCFRRAAELQPQSPQIQYNLALTYYQMNQFADARPPLETALARWPDIFQLNSLYGAVLIKLGEDASAQQALDRAHELNPQDSSTTDMLYRNSLQLAQKAHDARQYLPALQYLQEAAKLKPEESEPHRRMSEIYSLTAQAAKASAEQREADRLNKSSPN